MWRSLWFSQKCFAPLWGVEKLTTKANQLRPIKIIGNQRLNLHSLCCPRWTRSQIIWSKGNVRTAGAISNSLLHFCTGFCHHTKFRVIFSTSTSGHVLCIIYLGVLFHLSCDDICVHLVRSCLYIQRVRYFKVCNADRIQARWPSPLKHSIGRVKCALVIAMLGCCGMRRVPKDHFDGVWESETAPPAQPISLRTYLQFK